MGEYADMAVDESLDPYWGEDEDDDTGGWFGRRPLTHAQKVAWASANPSPLSDFDGLYDA